MFMKYDMLKLGGLISAPAINVSNDAIMQPVVAVTADDDVSRLTIEGDLILNSTDKVYHCEIITGSLIIDDSYDANTISPDQFPKLKRIEGSFTILNNTHVELVQLDKLEYVGDTVSISFNTVLKKIKLNNLQKYEKEFSIHRNPLLTTLEVHELKEIGEDIIYGSAQNGLGRRSSFSVQGNDKLENVELYKLDPLYTVFFSKNKNLGKEEIKTAQQLFKHLNWFNNRHATALLMALYGILKNQRNPANAPFVPKWKKEGALGRNIRKLPKHIIKGVIPFLEHNQPVAVQA